jgi:predicted alpha/beta-fold hydrolase
MNRKAEFFPERYQSGRFFAPRTLREWDNSITAPECGYRDAADYYHRVSALHVTPRIRVPTLILAAQDDPLVPITSLRNSEIERNLSLRW